jgi:putative alpha-1,2-mannosidase
MAIGLFDVEGGAGVKPTYQLTSPIFDRVAVRLPAAYFTGRKFTLETRKNSPENIYIQSARLNGQPLNRCWIEHSELIQGGKLELTLGPTPNKEWGMGR